MDFAVRGMDLSQIDMLRKGELARGETALHDCNARERCWRHMAQVGRGVAGCRGARPADQQFCRLRCVARSYVAVFCGDVSARPRAWAAAAVVVAVAVLGRVLIAPSPIEEGHNVFLPAPALERALPADVYRELLAAFDAQYPPAVRCDPKSIRLLAQRRHAGNGVRLFRRQYLARD